MSSRTRKILELAKSHEANESVSTEKRVKSIQEDITFENEDIELGSFIVDEDATLILLNNDRPTEAVVGESNLSTDTLGHLSFPLDVSEAEALTAVDDLTCNLQSVVHNYSTGSFDQPKNTSDVTPVVEGIHNNIVVVAEVYNESNQLPDPKVVFAEKPHENNPVTNNLVENEIELYETIENDLEHVIEIYEPMIENEDQDKLEDNSTFEVRDQQTKRKSRKRHQVQEEDWQCKQAKILREQGKAYKGRKISDGKVIGYVSRPERSMKPINCKCKGKTFQCATLSEPDRKRIFESFWALTWKERKMLVRTSTDIISLTQRARDRKEETKSRRSFSFKFYLYIDKRTKVRVFKKTLLATLGIGEWMVNNWLEESKEKQDDDGGGSEIDAELIEEPELNENAQHKKSSQRVSRQLDLNNRLKMLQEFLIALPKVESHYCRKSSTKLYLEPEWTSKAQLFQFYVENWCKENDCKPLSSCTFHKTFNDLNLALYRPKKDQCDICRAHKLKHISDEVFESHTKNKDDAREKKSKDKRDEQHVYTVDLQSLLLTPKSNALALYYRSKLSVHNLTVFDLKTQDGYCYLWNETEGELSANEFASILTDFIESQLPLRNNKIVIYSDGCNYQNRSAIMSNALLHMALKYQITIESKYLEKGHTQMECDAMHAAIERYLKPREIHVPADFIDACKSARRNRPYKVKYLEHSFFKDFSKPIMVKSIRPGSKKGDAKVTDIRCLKYSEDGKIYYKLSFKDEFKLLPAFKNNEEEERCSRKSVRKSTRNDKTKTSSDFEEKTRELQEASFRPLYNERLKIKRAKYQHLQELKLSIPRDYHSFYDDLPYM